MSDAEWAGIATEIMHGTGLAPRSDEAGVRWVAVRHADDHIHIVATLARQDGTRPRIWNDFYRVREACRAAEERLGLRATPPADRTAAKRPSRAETEQAARRGWDEPPRVTLRRHVCGGVAGARTERDFFDRLAAAGVLVRKRYSALTPGQVTGYAVGLPHHRNRDGGVIWYSGGKLAADLTLPKLRTRWSGSGADHALGAGLSAPAARGLLRKVVSGAADQAGSEDEFFTRLRAAGVEVRRRFSDVFPGQVTGYAVTLSGHTRPDGTAIWYGGGRLAAGLTLPQLRSRWETHQRAGAERSGAGLPRLEFGAERPGAFRFTTAERHAIYSDAARQAATAAEHIRRHAWRDPDRAADAAQAATDTLHAAARVTNNRYLRCAADWYDRAARAPFGHMPYRTRDGDRLRAVARVLALTGSMHDDNLPLAASLIANLVDLAVAVAELRQAQRHAAQASAARTAAEHLYAARAQIRASASSFARAEAQRSARPTKGANWVNREFPLSPLAGLREPVQPAPAAAAAASSSPHRTSGQSARASPRR